MFNLFYLLTSFPHILGFVSRGTFDFFYLIPTIQRYNIVRTLYILLSKKMVLLSSGKIYAFCG